VTATRARSAGTPIPGAGSRGVRPVSSERGAVRILDQRLLPGRERYLVCATPSAVADAIRSLAVRGAPLIGIAGAYGTALAAERSHAKTGAGVAGDTERAARLLAHARPTASNLALAASRVAAAARAEAVARGGAEAVRDAARRAALDVDLAERDACAAIGAFGAALVPEGARVLTHCNTGTLATNWDGTAQAVITAAFDAGKGVRVWVDETRPVLQGARLTAWELHRRGVPMTLVADTVAGSLMARGEVDLVVVGADRIAANGDVANKIGTYQLAVLARHHGIPFYVAAPITTVDLRTRSGEEIDIEQRDAREVTAPAGVPIAARGTAALNPAFDVTPSALITAIVTDAGVVRRPYPRALARAVAARRGPGA
jgi:methylthioribose-1-phosphate isomerase